MYSKPKEPVKARHYDPTLIPDISENAHATPYYGLWEKEIEVNGKKRRVCLYTPKSYFPNERVVIICPPCGMTAEELLNASAWMDIAEGEDFAIIALEAENGGRWGSLAEEGEYVEEAKKAVFMSLEAEFMAVGFDGHYLIGYGEGASLAARYALSHPVSFSGLAVLGSDEIGSEELNAIGDAKLDSFGIRPDTRACPLPMWIATDAGKNSLLIDYGKEINNTGDTFVCDEYGKIYSERPSFHNGSRNREFVSLLRVTVMEDAEKSYTDEKFTAALWTELFSKIIRYGEGPCGVLRRYLNEKDIGLQVYREKMPHANFPVPINRIWAVYAPSDYDAEKSYPLVVATHGFTGSYEMFARNTEWWRVAEERKFIVVFTNAAPNDMSRTGTPRWRSGYKNTFKIAAMFDTEEAFDSEITYFRRVIKSVSDDYNIDKTRIYCTGHSNGAEMTYGLSEEMKDIFAATAMNGFSVRGFNSEDEMPMYPNRMPYLNIEDGFDRETDPDDPDSALNWELRYRLKENGLAMVDAVWTEVSNGLYSMRSYENGDGVPMVNFVNYPNTCHNYFPEHSYLVWDEFFVNFSRGEDGRARYRGKLIK